MQQGQGCQASPLCHVRRPAVLAQIDKALEKEGRVLQVDHCCSFFAVSEDAFFAPAMHAGPLAGQVQKKGDGAMVFLRLVVVRRLACVQQDGEITCEELYLLQVRFAVQACCIPHPTTLQHPPCFTL
jgi:hypothetical protein